MAMRSDIEARVARHLIDAPSAISPEIPLWIQSSQARLEDRRVFKACESEAVFVTADGFRLLGAKPSDWCAVRDLPYVLDGAGGVSVIAWIHSDLDIRRLYSSDPLEKGSPKHVHELETGFEVYPLPDALCLSGSLSGDGSYRLHIPYWKRLDKLTSASSSNWFVENAFDLLTWETVADGFEFLQDEERSSYWRAKANKEIERLISEKQRARLPRSMTLRYRTGARDGSFSGRRV